MNINEAFPSQWLSAADLQGREILTTMADVRMEEVGGDPKMVLYFQGAQKGLVLNKTNANNISDVYGPETGAWFGQQIIVYPTTTDFQGRTVACIRVKRPSFASAPAQAAPLSGNAVATGFPTTPSAFQPATVATPPVPEASSEINPPPLNDDPFDL